MYTFNADHHFVIGQDHITAGKPCQDHALSFVSAQAAGIAIADGCSSAGETDMGARVLTFGTIAAMKESHKEACSDHAIFSQVIARKGREALLSARNSFGLVREDTLATCAYAYCGEEGGLATLYGDGVLAFQYRDGTISMFRFDWADNTPFYPAYAGDSDESFALSHGGDNVLALTEEWWNFVPEEGFVPQSEIKRSLREGVRGITRLFAGSEFEKLESIAVFTDGVTRIDGIDWKDAVQALLSFRNMTGVFVKRRMNSVLREMRKLGKGPLDDIAYAVIGVSHIDEEGEDHGSTPSTEDRS